MKLPGSICCRLFRCAKHFIMLQGILIHIFMNFIGLWFYFCSLNGWQTKTFIFSVLYPIISLLYSYRLYGYNLTKRKRPVWARIDVDYRNQWWVYFIFGLCQAVFMRIRRMMILCTVSASKRPWLTNLLLLFSLCILCQKKPIINTCLKKEIILEM